MMTYNFYDIVTLLRNICLICIIFHPLIMECVMSIRELTAKVKEASPHRTHEMRVRMLKAANIIDKDGYYSEQFFSKETVEKDRKSGKAVTA